MIIDTDSYKDSHFLQYPPNTTGMEAHLSARVGAKYPYTQFFGLQYLLKEYFSHPIIMEEIEEAAIFCKAHGEPFPYDGFRHIIEAHKGFLPLEIRAVKEGAVIPGDNILLTVKSTDPKVPWLVGWFETQLMRLWFPCTVATRSFACKQVIFKYLTATADDPMGEIDFKLHDFGSRGTSSAESAMLGGMGHLCNFKGTDNQIALYGIQKYYNKLFSDKINPDPYMKGFSIPAMEHSTVISWGEGHEEDAFRNMISKHPDYKVLACVSDSYDFLNAVENIWCNPDMVNLIKNKGVTIVIRPDSGDALLNNLKALEIITKKVGYTTNSKGFKVLPPYFRLIQGDGNNSEKDIDNLLGFLKMYGYSASNIAFGMGGGLLQKLDRDTQRFKYAMSQIVVDGKPRSVAKNPKTDPSKKSRSGHLDLIKLDGEYKTIARQEGESEEDSQLQLVYQNGILCNKTNFDKVREQANESFIELTPTV